jgi:hypothetical protein
MILSEIFQKVLVESGQFLLAADEIEINPDRFLVLVKSSLAVFNKYDPLEKKFNLDAPQRLYTFTETSKDVQQNVVGIPDGIADVVPVRIAGISPYFLRDFEGHRSDYLIEKAEWPWEYRKPNLYVPLNGTLDIHAWYKHKITETVNEDQTKSYDLPTISEEDENFFGLLTAKFLKGLGGSRRAFTMTDLPLTTDAPELIAAGKEMEETFLKAMQDESKFWLAYG